MKTISGTCGAWLSSSYVNSDPEDFNNLHITSSNMTDCGWVKVGQAEITVYPDDKKEILKSQIDVLETAERKLMADTQVKLNAIRGQIQSLMAIEFQP